MLLAALSDWLTPEVIVPIVLLVLSLAKNWAQKNGNTALATKLETTERVAGVVVRGIETAKKTKGVDPATVAAFVEAIRAESTSAGVEPVLKPIVQAVRAAAPDAPVEAVVRAATTRLDARRVS